MPVFGRCRSVFMRNREKDAAQMAVKRRDFLAKACKPFAKKNIESVTMIGIAGECGYGTRSGAFSGQRVPTGRSGSDKQPDERS
jgi:hypothetical protein